MLTKLLLSYLFNAYVSRLEKKKYFNSLLKLNKNDMGREGEREIVEVGGKMRVR